MFSQLYEIVHNSGRTLLKHQPHLSSDRNSFPSLQNMFACSASDLQAVLAIAGSQDVAKRVCSTVDVAAAGNARDAVIQYLARQSLVSQQRQTELEIGVNTGFLLASAYQVFIMQAGFALYAAGTIRAKNIMMVLLKNFIDACIAVIAYYLVGYGLELGSDSKYANGFIGTSDFALHEVHDTEEGTPGYANWYWNWAFAAASTTILSGAVAERSTFHAYLIYSFMMTTWVYPVVAHWLWSEDGWLSAYKDNSILKIGSIDFSGSGVVHTLGGFAALMACIATGPRTGRFDGLLPRSAFKGHSPPLYVLGVFMLWFGWYGFNPGSHHAISNKTLANAVARTAVTTTMGAGSGALACLAMSWWRYKTWDLLQICTGTLAGLVAVTAGCGVLEPWAAIIGGVIAGPVYIFGEELLERLEIDDPVGAFPVHGLCGLWGLLLVGLLGKEQYIVEVYGKPAGSNLMGIFYGGHGQLLLCQVIAMVVIAGWSMFWVGGLFWLLDRYNMLRTPLAEEAMGLDKAACGEVNGVHPFTTTKLDTITVDGKGFAPVNNNKGSIKARQPTVSSSHVQVEEGQMGRQMRSTEMSSSANARHGGVTIHTVHAMGGPSGINISYETYSDLPPVRFGRGSTGSSTGNAHGGPLGSVLVAISESSSRTCDNSPTSTSMSTGVETATYGTSGTPRTVGHSSASAGNTRGNSTASSATMQELEGAVHGPAISPFASAARM